jgi:hypothetical protein
MIYFGLMSVSMLSIEVRDRVVRVGRRVRGGGGWREVG